jgi:hypothetical protein
MVRTGGLADAFLEQYPKRSNQCGSISPDRIALLFNGRAALSIHLDR